MRGLLAQPSPVLPAPIQTEVLVDYLFQYDRQEHPFFSMALHMDSYDTTRARSTYGFLGITNLPSVQPPCIIDCKLDREISLGCTAGPFQEPPFPDFHLPPWG